MLRRTMLGVALTLALCVSASPALANVGSGHSGWFWGNPQPQGNRLDRAVFSGLTGYATGTFGTLLRTGDGGESWTALDSQGIDASRALAVPAPQTAVLALDDCELRRTDNAGRSFADQRIVSADTRCPGQIAHVDFATPRDGIVTLENGFAYWTADSGRSWTRRADLPMGSNAAGELKLLSPGRAVIAAGGAGMLLSQDGGRSWRTTQPVDPSHQPSSLSFSDSQNGYAVGSGGLALRTIDGGSSWTQIALAGGIDPAVSGSVPPTYSSVACGDPQTCVVTFPGRYTIYSSSLRTNDGGVTATPSSLPPETRPFAATAQRYVALGFGGEQSVSRDGGATFASIGAPLLSEDIAGLRALSPHTALGFGDGGLLLRTDDRGRTWRSQRAAGVGAVLDADSPTPAITYVVEKKGGSRRGGVLRTENGGVDFQETSARTGRDRTLLALSARTVIVGGDGLWRSTDGVRTVRRASGAGARGSVFSLDRAGKALVAFGERRLVRSTDRGKTWRVLRRPTRGSVTSADFTSARRGYVVASRRKRGGDARVYTTADGGRHWRELPAHGVADPYGVAFGDRLHGYLVGRSGSIRVLATSDGGLSWRPQLIAPAYGDGIVPAAWGSRTAYTAGRAGLFATVSAGDGPIRSRVTLRAKRGRGRVVRLSGRLSPARAGQTVTLRIRTGRKWASQTAMTARGGRYSAVLRPRRSALVVAQFSGSGTLAAAGTRAITLRVRR